MRLIENWRHVLKRSLSVKFQLVQAVGTGMLSGVYGYTMGWSLLAGTAFCVACVGFSCQGIVARIVWQKDFHPENCDAGS